MQNQREEGDESDQLATAEEIIEEARNGRMFILVDDEDRENEGDLIIPAQFATPSAINFMAKHGRGLICLAMTAARADALGLPMMSQINETRHETAFTVSIEAREGVTTGISAADRARTITVAIDGSKGRDHIVTPGHVFPLKAREGGVLVRAGHTEAAVDIARLAGLIPAGVICEMMTADGYMARLPELLEFAAEHRMKVGTIADLISYRRRHDRMVVLAAEADLVSDHGGAWRTRSYLDTANDIEHLVLIKGAPQLDRPVPVRMHAFSLYPDVLGESLQQRSALNAAMEAIGREGDGIIVVIRDPKLDRLSDFLKIRAGQAPRVAHDGILREYGIGAQILVDLGVREMVLLTNSRHQNIVGLEGYGLTVVEERPF